MRVRVRVRVALQVVPLESQEAVEEEAQAGTWR